MNNLRYLVTAANGNTGFTTAKSLLENGCKVRILVRNSDTQKVSLLSALGAEVVIGDMDNFDDVTNSLVGVTRAYVCAPFDKNALLKTANFTIAAESAQVEHIVYMSQWLLNSRHPAINTREQWLAKQIALLHKNVNYTFINTGLFGFTYFFTAQMVTQLGLYPTTILPELLDSVAFNAPPSEEDQGRVIAHILMSPDNHISKTYRITGPELISHQDVINSYEDLLGRKIKPMHVSEKMLFKSLKAMGFSSYQFINVQHYLKELELGAFSFDGGVTQVVKNITGQAPEPFSVMLKRELIANNLLKRTFSSRCKALGFFIKALFTPAPNLAQYEKQQNIPTLASGSMLSINDERWKTSHKLYTSDYINNN